MAVRRWKAERSQVPFSHASQTVFVCRIGGFGDESRVAKLGRQQVPAQYSFGVLEVPGIAVPTENQVSFDDVAGVVALALVGRAVVGATLDHPAQFVADRPQPVVGKGPHALQKCGVAGQVRKLRQRGHDAGRRVRVHAELLAVIRPVRQEEVGRGFLGQERRQFERFARAGGPEVLDQRADGAGDSRNEGVLPGPANAVGRQNPFPVPAVHRVPRVEYERDAGFGHFPRFFGVSILDQGVERVHALAHVVIVEVLDWPVHAVAVHGQRHGAGVG